jgi:hypothetical protein
MYLQITRNNSGKEKCSNLVVVFPAAEWAIYESAHIHPTLLY